MKYKLFTRAGLLLVAALISFNVTRAQSVRPLSLKEAIDLGVKNSKLLKQHNAKILEATAAVREAEERKLPDFNISGSYIRLNSPNIDLKTKPASSGTGTGTTPAKISQATYGLANLSLPIYAGGRIRYGIESARYLAEAAKLDVDHDKEQVIQNTIDAYSNLYKSKASLEIVNENLKQSRQRVTEFSSLEKNGLLARNDLLKAQLQSSNIELTLLDAENNWKMANINMNLMIGLPEETELMPDSAGFVQPSSVATVDVWEQLAFQNRKDISALALQKKAAATGVKATRAELYPSLALTGGYIAAQVPNFVTITNAVNVGVGVQYNFASLWKNKSKVEQAKARVIQVEAGEDMLNDAIRLQVNQAYQDYFLTKKKIDVLKQSVEQANENYRITKNKYNNSLATTTDLLDANFSQLLSNIQFTLAKVDAVVAYHKLLQAAGMLSDEKK